MAARELTVDGFEKTLQVNHLAPFLLTNLLLPRLVASQTTVIATASAGNAFGRIDTNDLQNQKKYSPAKAYANAKLANILFTRELDFRYRSQGISAAAFHPGAIASNFGADSSSVVRFAYRTRLRRLLSTSETGADTLIWLATSQPGVDWPYGEYFVKRKVAKANPQAYETGLASWLWNTSAAMVGLDQ
ncbi:MAG: SDR family NAD(P)-dependent oxidoreductase, partial [Rhodoglobus sp.]